MLSKLFKRKNNEIINEEAINNNSLYKNLEVRSNNVGGVKEYEVTMTDTGTGTGHFLRRYVFKIAHDISISYKKINLDTNNLDISNFKVIPCFGIEKVTSEFHCKEINYRYEFEFNFKFWHKTSEVHLASNKAYIHFVGFSNNTEYPEGIEELLYQIQNDMQKAIENARD
ncbi:hypothetical protein [Bacillus pseudomycoides]|uniref:hypothetical protein n=1 Tax=Bacillus pseudomycoides TaxID=64104 RepID=UPI000BF1F2AA|nr:hypothetical protein [Bacillus pseudomycoides]PEI44601.1 hypothetical protein CN641_15835 [Bacillus pseudomycoides]PFY13903.1 hypothetical protein COL42_20555 [Bacillus pseudomycoides]